MREEKTKWLVRCICIVLVLSVAAGMHILLPHFFSTIWQYMQQKDIEGMAAYIASFGYGAVVICIFLIALANAVGIPTIQFLSINGIIFGLLPGIVVSWLGEVLGIEIAFRLMRTLFRKKAQQIIRKNARLGQVNTYSTMRTILIGRAIPYAPNVVVTAVAAMSRISYKDHFIANLIGKLPAVIVEVWLGHDLFRIQEHSGRLTALLVLLVAVYGVVWYRRHRKKPRK